MLLYFVINDFQLLSWTAVSRLHFFCYYLLFNKIHFLTLIIFACIYIFVIIFLNITAINVTYRLQLLEVISNVLDTCLKWKCQIIIHVKSGLLMLIILVTGHSTISRYHGNPYQMAVWLRESKPYKHCHAYLATCLLDPIHQCFV